MRLVLHPKVYSDIAQIMEYYEQVASVDLADEFYRIAAAHTRGSRET
jgi:hypothetical protein